MIDETKCQTCYPVVASIIEMKFEGQKELKQCVLRAWKECDQPAIEHVIDYVDPSKPGTIFILHRCAEHAKPLPKKQDRAEDMGMRDCFGGTS